VAPVAFTSSGPSPIVMVRVTMFLLEILAASSFAQVPPPNTGTGEETAKLAAAAGKYDIAGMKLGIPLKEAMQVLKAHNPKFQLTNVTTSQDHVISITG
jgi:hypothetical protein